MLKAASPFARVTGENGTAVPVIASVKETVPVIAGLCAAPQEVTCAVIVTFWPGMEDNGCT